MISRTRWRIIPASARNTERQAIRRRPTPEHPRTSGNSRSTSLRSPRCANYPRARGERRESSITSIVSYGSSPRSRGTPRELPKNGAVGRIIPAPAGNTTSKLPRRTETTDHPRARGEHTKIADIIKPEHGSSPRPRETRRRMARGGAGLRIIPAPAGNTSSCGVPRCARTDHPRARGEHSGCKAVISYRYSTVQRSTG